MGLQVGALGVDLVTGRKVALMDFPLLVVARVARRHRRAHQVVPDAVLQELGRTLQPVSVHRRVLLKDQRGLLELLQGEEGLGLIAEYVVQGIR